MAKLNWKSVFAQTKLRVNQIIKLKCPKELATTATN